MINPSDQSRSDDVQARMPETNGFTKGKRREEWVRNGKNKAEGFSFYA
jgi:hypothetical protein